MMLYGALAWLTFGVMSSKLALLAGTSLCSPTYASAQVPSKVVVLRPLAVGNFPFDAFTYLDLSLEFRQSHFHTISSLIPPSPSDHSPSTTIPPDTITSSSLLSDLMLRKESFPFMPIVEVRKCMPGRRYTVACN